MLRWCLDFALRGHSRLEDDPTLPGFDLFVLHVDADVAESNYGGVSPEIEEVAKERAWPPLPCSLPCPPPSTSADEMRCRLLRWASLTAPGPKTVLCVPSKATDAWLAAAVFDQGHTLLGVLECNLNLEAQLKALPQGERVKKKTREYRDREKKITAEWSTVRQRCTQAERFSSEVLAVALREAGDGGRIRCE